MPFFKVSGNRIYVHTILTAVGVEYNRLTAHSLTVMARPPRVILQHHFTLSMAFHKHIWRGGRSIFRRAVLRASGYGLARTPFVCDSFAEGWTMSRCNIGGINKRYGNDFGSGTNCSSQRQLQWTRQRLLSTDARFGTTTVHRVIIGELKWYTGSSTSLAERSTRA
jgi:hypothetical protein